MTAGRYALERTLPDGTVKRWPGTFTPREAGQAVAYCLVDNGATASPSRATRAGQRIESHPVGEWLDTVGGYRFRRVEPEAPAASAPSSCCPPCADGEHADDGTGTPCTCCGAERPDLRPTCRNCGEGIEPDDNNEWRHAADGVAGCGQPFTDTENYAEPTPAVV